MSDHVSKEPTCANCGHAELDHGMDAYLDDEGFPTDEFRAECCVEGCDCTIYNWKGDE